MNPAFIGALQGVGLAIILTVLSYFADAAHLNGLINPQMATLIAAICLAMEKNIEASTGKSLFGSVRM
jgi:hypothetical protein